MIPTKENLEKLNKKKLKINKKISNNFIESTISKSNATALKIIYYLASKITEIDLETNYNTIQLDLKEMLEYTNLTRQNIRDNIKRMQQTSITFIDEENNIESGISLLPEYHFYWNKNRVDIVLNRKIAKLIVDVSKRYTSINTKELVRLKNKNSIRLLPILHMINGYNVKQKTLSISELNALFGTNYKKFVEMERGVLKKVKTELDDNSSLSFDYDINFESTGKGRPKAVSATLYPTLRKNYQTTIFSNLEYQPEENPTEKEHIETPEDYQKRLQRIKDLESKNKRLKEEASKLQQNVNVIISTYQEKIFYQQYKYRIDCDLQGYFINSKEENTKFINKRKNISIEDAGDKIISYSDSDNLTEQVKIMLEIAKAKGWDFNQLHIRGTEQFKAEVKRQIEYNEVSLDDSANELRELIESEKKNSEDLKFDLNSL